MNMETSDEVADCGVGVKRKKLYDGSHENSICEDVFFVGRRGLLNDGNQKLDSGWPYAVSIGQPSLFRNSL